MPEDVIYKGYLPYRDRGLLPAAGGTLDQPADVMDAFDLVDRMVSWHIYNEQLEAPTNDIPDLDDMD